MKIDGQLKADEIRVARIIIDHLKDPVEISALAGLISTKDNQTLTWTKANGLWSDETREAINTVRELMTRDIHKALFGVVGTDATSAGGGMKLGLGLAEHLSGEDDAPSI